MKKRVRWKRGSRQIFARQWSTNPESCPEVPSICRVIRSQSMWPFEGWN